MEHIPIMDLGLKSNEINALKTALYCILRGLGGGGTITASTAVSRG